MMRTARAIVSLSIALCWAATAALSQEMPDEIREKYPDDRYIVRSGTGETPEQAANSARAEIARFFESKISGETLVNQWAKSTIVGNDMKETRMTEVTNSVVVGTSREIPGIEIVESKENRDVKAYVAWAVLEKAGYANILRERVEQVDRNVGDRLADPGDTDLRQLNTYTKVMKDLILREQYRQDMMLLGGGPSFDPRDGLLNTVMTTLDSIVADAFDVAVVFEGDVENRVRSGLVDAIVAAGIRLKEYSDIASAASAGADMAMIVEHTPSIREASFRNRTFHHAEWVLSVRAVVPSTGEVVDSLVLEGKKAGAANEAQARQRMISDILGQQVPQVTKWVYSIIFTPDE